MVDQAIANKGVAARTVVVACKAAFRALELQLCEPHKVQENTQTGPREIVQWRRVGRIFIVRGTAYPRGEVPEGYPDKPETVGGYALTYNIPKDFWDKWEEQNSHNNPLIVSNMMKAFPDVASVRDWAKEHEGLKSGFEPVSVKKIGGIDDPRVQKPINRAISPLETAVTS